jgi:hypothetical protein
MMKANFITDFFFVPEILFFIPAACQSLSIEFNLQVCLISRSCGRTTDKSRYAAAHSLLSPFYSGYNDDGKK